MKAVHLPKATGMAHRLIQERVSPGDCVVDATVGNGHDTLFLAKCVGETGTVIGLDIQPQAIDAASEILTDFPQVTLHQMDHAKLSKVVSTPVKAAMFNLGYLPSGDKEVITKPSSTIAALEVCTKLLASGGIITVVIYTGHDGGLTEANAVEAWCSERPQSEYSVAQYRFINQINHPPHLIVIERK